MKGTILIFSSCLSVPQTPLSVSANHNGWKVNKYYCDFLQETMPKAGYKHCQHVAMPVLSSDPPVFVWPPLEQLQPYAHTAGHFNSGLQVCPFLQWTALKHHVAQTPKLKYAATLHCFLIILAAHQLSHPADPPSTHTMYLSGFLSLQVSSSNLSFPWFFKSHTDSISEIHVVLRDISVSSLFPFMLIW